MRGDSASGVLACMHGGMQSATSKQDLLSRNCHKQRGGRSPVWPPQGSARAAKPDIE